MANPVAFTQASASRIARVVRKVEAGNRDTAWVPSTPIQSNGRSNVFRVGQVTGAWTKGSAKTVTLSGIAATGQTASALNLFADITNTTTYNCAIAMAGTAWYLIAAEC